MKRVIRNTHKKIPTKPLYDPLEDAVYRGKTPKSGRHGNSKFNLKTMTEQAKVMGMLGFSLKQMAHLMGITYMSLRNYRKRYKAFDDAVVQGTTQANATAINKLFHLVKEGNFQAIKYWLDVRAGWKSSPEIGINVQGDVITGGGVKVVNNMIIDLVSIVRKRVKDPETARLIVQDIRTLAQKKNDEESTKSNTENEDDDSNLEQNESEEI